MKTLVTYVPHGIDSNMFYPITEGDKHWTTLVNESKKIRGSNPDKFVVLWNNRNIHRKHPGDVVLAYRDMCISIDSAGGNAATDCVLVMHTVPVDGNGTDLTAVASELCPEYQILFSDAVIPSEAINILYNCADVVLNMASNEGFGLSTAESLMAGTPIVVNVIGGLQDQCGFVNPSTGELFTPEDYVKIQTLHRKELWSSLDHGQWVKPVWPSNISLQGSVPTPYIFDERADYREVGDALLYWYNMPRDERKRRGIAGREFVMTPEVGFSRSSMCAMAIDSIEKCFEQFTSRNRYELLSV